MGASSVHCRRFKSTNTTSVKLDFTYEDLLNITRQGEQNEKYKDQCDTEGNPSDHVRPFCEHENGIISRGQSLLGRRDADTSSKEHNVVPEWREYGKRTEKNDGEEMENYCKGGNVLYKR